MNGILKTQALISPIVFAIKLSDFFSLAIVKTASSRKSFVVSCRSTTK